jgi:DNA-binding transcriptional LysR family regulator
MLAPVFRTFQEAHPAVVIRFLTDMRLFRLDYGEAHVAIRAGAAPQEPDNVAQPLVTLKMGLYASKAYVQRHGCPLDLASLAQHRFVGVDNPENRAPFYKWLREMVPQENMTLRVSEPAGAEVAVKAGLGLGFMRAHEARKDPDLVEVMAPIPEWDSPLWIVTHVDLHRTLKVQSFLACLKAAAAHWGMK